MKKKDKIFVVGLVLIFILSMVIFGLGFGLFAVASIPFQDSQYVTQSALDKQARDILIGEIMMLTGAGLLGVSVMVGGIAGVIAIAKKVLRRENA